MKAPVAANAAAAKRPGAKEVADAENLPGPLLALIEKHGSRTQKSLEPHAKTRVSFAATRNRPMPRMWSHCAMSDQQLMEFISTHCESLHIQHNAHRETDTTVARHLLHRERLGDIIIFASTTSRVRCMESEAIWEVSIRHRDDTQTHIAGASLDECMELASATMGLSNVNAIAA